VPASYVAKLWASAAAGAAVAWGVKLGVPALHPVLTAILVLGPYGAIFFGMTFALHIPEAASAMRRVLRFKR